MPNEHEEHRAGVRAAVWKRPYSTAVFDVVACGGSTRGTGRYGSLPALVRGAAVMTGLAYAGPAMAQTIAVSPTTMPRVATVDQRYQSYNVEMAEVIGGTFWKPYRQQGKAAQNAQQAANGPSSSGADLQADSTMFEARPPIDLTNTRLRKLAAALGPAYMRVSGTWANTVFFHDSDTAAPASPPRGFRGVLTRPQWKAVIDFAHAVNARLTTSFAISAGVRDAAGEWTPDQARDLLAYTKAIGGGIAAAEFFNEPTMPKYGGAPAGYDAPAYARDLAAFRRVAKQAAPHLSIVGPASVGEAVLLPAMQPGSFSVLKTADLLSADPPPVFDIFSYHYYGAVSIRCASMGPGAQTSAESALSEEWLSRVDRSYNFYSGLRDRFEPGRPIWITEMADAACGGNPWANTFMDTFRYLDQHARLAKHGVSAVFHNARCERIRPSRPENVRAAPELLGRPALAPSHGRHRARCGRSHPRGLARLCATACPERQAGSRCLQSTIVGRKPRRLRFQSRPIATRCRRMSLKARQSN